MRSVQRFRKSTIAFFLWILLAVALIAAAVYLLQDQFIYYPHNYSVANLKGKKANKKALQGHFGLPQRDSVPLLGVVGRMADQKGFDLILHALPELMERDVQLVMVGSGDKGLEQAFRETLTS